MHRICVVALVALSCAAPARADLLYTWTQFDRSGAPVVRAILDATDACPMLTTEPAPVQLQPRAESPPPGFADVIVCEGPLPSGARSARVNGVSVPVPTGAPETMLVLGDTGCRVKHDDVQNCTGRGVGPAWDFVGIATAAAREAPDLVIHVGDYHYREMTPTCGNSCEQSNLGFTWQSWKVDFFDPARSLLAAAPWVPIRGNHEDCTRAWRGWFYFLAPGPVPAGPWPNACPSGESGNGTTDWFYSGPYAIDSESFRAVVMDTSYLQHDYAPAPSPKTVDRYAAEFEIVETLAGQDGKPVWLLMHRPIWAVASFSGGSCPCAAEAAVTDLTLQAAVARRPGGVLPASVIAVISGHIHLSERLVFTDGKPAQLVFGAGGTQLDPDLGTNAGVSPATQAVLETLKADPAGFIWSDEFDYGLVTAVASGWNVAVRNRIGETVSEFSLP